ncbi:MAG: D-glycero-D-manno-heptose 1,7-bisphosphate phosphatase [Rhodoferax sp.]|nr:D-glycero-D-manno-heptose 1,7-bisphosphate phosphatase [Rhodoferax sp.]
MALIHLLGEPARGARASARLPRAVFVDKDGTLVEDVPYNVDPALLRFTPNAIDGLRLLVDAGYLIVVVTNQPGVALGRFDQDALRHLQTALTRLLAQAGVPLAGFQFCPHAPAAPGTVAACQCRKPAPGMLQTAASRLNVNLAASWMVGDILDDVEAGHRAGCRSVLLDVGNETLWERTLLRTPDAVASYLLGAAQEILAREGGEARGRGMPRASQSRAAPQKGAVRWLG